jgi:hypothetical protein
LSDGIPTSSRLRRTSRLGGLVAVQGSRIAGGRALDRVRSDEARERAQAEVAAVRAAECRVVGRSGGRLVAA